MRTRDLMLDPASALLKIVKEIQNNGNIDKETKNYITSLHSQYFSSMHVCHKEIPFLHKSSLLFFKISAVAAMRTLIPKADINGKCKIKRNIKLVIESMNGEKNITFGEIARFVLGAAKMIDSKFSTDVSGKGSFSYSPESQLLVFSNLGKSLVINRAGESCIADSEEIECDFLL